MGARFVRLAIAGFKSFADSAALEILPGLTGIVGPNGCGKSNVAEALRWAMGEANARHLRGGEMDDIIFAGTATRASRNLAEVTLTVEDDSAGLPPPFSGQTELHIVRRIERGAGSVYRVNGRETRARDVQTLFADIASGARSSAMVSQGRVGALVNARAEERRAVLEEAAGITGLHARRAEAETRLRATETNLERSEEHRAALTKQLGSLHEQAAQAARYRIVTAGFQDTEALLLAIQRDRARAAKSASVTVVREAKELVHRAATTSTRAQTEAAHQATMLPRLRIDENDATANVERAKMALEVVAGDLERAQAALLAASQRKSQLERDLAHAEVTLNEAEAIDSRLATEAERLAQDAEDHPELVMAAEREVECAATALRVADGIANEAAARASASIAQSAAASQILQQAVARERRAAEAVARITAERDSARGKLIDATRLDAALAAAHAAEQTLTKAEAAQVLADQAHTIASRAAATARDAFNRSDMLRQRLAAETAGLAAALDIKDGEKWPPLIDSLNVPIGLEAALGAALGEELGAATNPAAARHWRTLPNLPELPIPGTRMSSQVTGPPLLARALGAIGVVQSDKEGDDAQASLLPGQSIVSATGAVWRWDGYTIGAGTKSAATIRLQQHNRLRSLNADLEHAREDAERARISSQTAQQAEREAAANQAHARQRQREAEVSSSRLRSSTQALQLQAEVAQARLAAIVDELSRMAPEAEAATVALQAAQQDAARQPDPASLKQRADEARGAVSAARQRDIAASRALDALVRTAQSRMTRLATIERERADRRMRVIDLAGRVTDLRVREQEAADEYHRLSALPGSILANAQQMRQQVDAAEARRSAAQAERVAAERRADELARATQAAEQAAFAARENLIRAEAADTAADQALQVALDRVAERGAALPPLPEPQDLSVAMEERARTRLSRLAREREGIGPVNLRAEIEAAAIEAEIKTMVHEREELETAVAKLRGSIGTLNREGRERLTAIFQQVDRHFQALFSRMFGGGRAYLALVGSDDPLQAGLEIYAQPPGKKLSALSLLSGGEQALTALSLIFAVFRCNPAPLCVLDEVDAPLDDANVSRFCALLADMVQETGTRFLVVTHHQVTMAAMDRLYGVTMQERGVSRLLSVDLSRAVGMVEAVAAE